MGPVFLVPLGRPCAAVFDHDGIRCPKSLRSRRAGRFGLRMLSLNGAFVNLSPQLSTLRLIRIAEVVHTAMPVASRCPAQWEATRPSHESRAPAVGRGER